MGVFTGVSSLIYGKVTKKNFMGIVDGVKQFCDVGTSKALGYRVSAVLRVCCDIYDGQVCDIDVSVYIGDRLNSGRFASATVMNEDSGTAVISMFGRRAGLGTRETARSRRLPLIIGDCIGFSRDDSLLLIYDKAGSKMDFLMKLRLRDIYALRLNNITERVTNCFASADDLVLTELCSNWGWSRKIVCLAALECLLRATGLWDKDAIRDECRNEAAVRLMQSDLIFGGVEGLDEFNMYSSDAEQRVQDSDLLVTCGRWLADGGADISSGLRAGDVTERDLSGWKAVLEADLGVVLPPLGKHGSMARFARGGSDFGVGKDSKDRYEIFGVLRRSAAV
jgi:hypothetical protein